MRLMSFAMTTEQVLAQTKTVTRRLGWADAKPGEVVQPVDRVMGFRKGERPTRLGGPIRIVDVRIEPLKRMLAEPYGSAEVIAEGFPQLSPREFVQMFLRSHRGCSSSRHVTRIQFEYTEPRR